MSDRLDHILYTLNLLHSASTTLTEYARELVTDPQARLTDFEEAPQLLAEALETAIDLLPEDRLTQERTQLVGALRRYLKGWTQ